MKESIMQYSYYSNPSAPKLPKRRSLKLKPLIIMLIVGLSIFGLSQLPLNSKQNVNVTPTKTIKETVVKNQITSAQAKYLFSGTVVLARAVESEAHGDYNQPFSGMDGLGTYDSAMNFFECPVTDGDVSFAVQVANLKFNCKPEWLPALKARFLIINLSSNHVYDMGAAGFTETVKRLKEANFQVIGNYNPHTEKDNCKVVIMPVRLQNGTATEEKAMLPIAFCSYNYKNLFSPAPGELESIQRWSKTMPVFAILNAGAEYLHTAGAEQTEFAHKMIDYGAEFVIGNGTHWTQNTEVYKGKLIVYSMGNFIFDQIDYDGRIHMNISVAMTVPYDNNLKGWLSLGATCVINTDDACLQSALSKGLTKLSPTYKFEAIGSYGGYKAVATRANAQQQADIEALANWTETLKELGQ